MHICVRISCRIVAVLNIPVATILIVGHSITELTLHTETFCPAYNFSSLIFLSNFETSVSVKNSVSVIPFVFGSNSKFWTTVLNVQLTFTDPSPIILSSLFYSILNNNNFSPLSPSSPTLQEHKVWEILYLYETHINISYFMIKHYGSQLIE
jgi:hypothetical protein